jgi:hypothetical protein
MGHIRGHGVTRLLVYCGSLWCNHSATLNADRLPDDTILLALDRRMVCTACGLIGADVRARLESAHEQVDSQRRAPTWLELLTPAAAMAVNQAPGPRSVARMMPSIYADVLGRLSWSARGPYRACSSLIPRARFERDAFDPLCGR